VREGLLLDHFRVQHLQNPRRQYTRVYISPYHVVLEVVLRQVRSRGYRWNPTSTEVDGKQGRICLSMFCKGVPTSIIAHLDGNNCWSKIRCSLKWKRFRTIL